MANEQRSANLHPTLSVAKIPAVPLPVSVVQVRSALAKGMEDMRSCVYGCCGCLTTSSTSPASATEPRYSTTILSLI